MADRCRSCNAEIEWAITEKGSRIPLDPGYRPDGNIILDPQTGIAHVTAVGGTRVSHFATCDDPQRFRRKDRMRAT